MTKSLSHKKMNVGFLVAFLLGGFFSGSGAEELWLIGPISVGPGVFAVAVLFVGIMGDWEK